MTKKGPKSPPPPPPPASAERSNAAPVNNPERSLPAPSPLSLINEPSDKGTATGTGTSPTLVICRNKHWRFISSFHGPWLQLPPEVLESLAYSNYFSPRPQPVDPAVFFDLVKIRRLVEEATSLAVRAANGTTSASLSTSLNAGNGILNGSDAEILGIGVTRGGGHAKLSRERKHRMREHATQKLSHAYHLDEIAASVATMQAASSLEDVAKLVLQRNEDDPDAKYVHFFHEKIPSRAMAEATSLNALDDIIRQRPSEAAFYRTRAVTKLFKDDIPGAIRDLTDGLNFYRLYNAKVPKNESRELILVRDAVKLAREARADGTVDEKDHPCSLEPQLLFHRAGAYLTLACDQIEPALRGLGAETARMKESEPQLPTLAQKEAQRLRQEASKLVRTYAKRALRDFTMFISRFDYTPGLPTELTDAFLTKINAVARGLTSRSRSENLLDFDSRQASADALVRYESERERLIGQHIPQLPKPCVYRLDALFSAVPAAELPPYPPKPGVARSKHSIFALPDFSEAVTYHPLLTDALHSMLLCHCLIQTSAKEHLRHAYMVARVARVCDGYPIFLSARSPARADWIEVIRRADNWIGLEGTWEQLCHPIPIPGKKRETAAEKRERTKREAVREALADERVFDEESFRSSVRAREMRAAREEEEEQRKEYLRTSACKHGHGHSHAHGQGHGHGQINIDKLKRWAQEEGKDYPISTERAEAIARWVRVAPPPGATAAGGETRAKKGGRKSRLRKTSADLQGEAGGAEALEQSVDSLDIVD